MSKRVHELAKELGLKTQELLDRIQKGGYDVKPSPLASLDPAMEAKLKKDFGQAVPAEAGTPAPVPAPVPPARTQPEAAAPPPPAPPRPSPAPAPAPAPAPVPTATRPAGEAAAPNLAPPRPPVSAPAPTPTLPLSSRPPASGPLSMHTRPGAAASSGSQRSGGGGPLASHTPHRAGTTPGRPAGEASAPPETTRPPTAAAPQQPAPQQPHRPTDYIGPAGTRASYLSSGRPSTPAPVHRSSARPPAGSGLESTRREPPVAQSGPRRPLPTVAAPTTPSTPPRRPEGPRLGGGGEPASQSQRPDFKMTPEQFRQMMQSGQLGGAPAPGGIARPGAPIGRPGTPPQHGGPAARRPPTGPGAIAPPAIAPPPPTNESEDDDRKGGKPGGRPGSSADRAGRRAGRAERAKERARVVPTSTVDARTLIEGDDDSGRIRGPRKHKGQLRGALIAPRKTVAQVEPPITIRNLSEAIGVKVNDLLRKLMTKGQLATINATLDDESARELALECGIELEVVYQRTAEDEMDDLFGDQAAEADAGQLQPRPPVITILGHVDHGKTSLLDKIRQANVVATESGGITQHIGAYQVEHNGKKLTFVDTPGHEAFTAMRARGANVTDIVVLVVAADDGVMPQTREAIAHAKAAEVPVVVALNKIDLPNVDSQTNITKIFGELAQEGLNPVEWGGDTEVIKTSAASGLGIPELLENLETLAELHELTANPDKPATGTCLEARLSEGRGVVATVLVQDGTLRVGDNIACGSTFGRVRALRNDLGQSVTEAPPSTPVEVSGLDQVPTAGEKFAALADIASAREVAEARRDRSRQATATERQELTLENLFKQVAEQKIKSLNLILKADVQGSLEALTKELEKIQNDEVPIRVLLKGVGGISESDVILADASKAIIIGFRVAPEDRAMSVAEDKKIDIRRYEIIYQVTDEVKQAVEGMLVPEIKEVYLGRAIVREVFKISKVGNVAGCVVTQGQIERSSKARILREGRELYKGELSALKRFKDDVREVREGYECGMKVANYDDIKVDDVIEAYRIDVIRRTL